MPVIKNKKLQVGRPKPDLNDPVSQTVNKIEKNHKMNANQAHMVLNSSLAIELILIQFIAFN